VIPVNAPEVSPLTSTGSRKLTRKSGIVGRDKSRTFESPLEYFTYNEPDGVGTTKQQVEFLIKGTPAEDRWRAATTPKKGGDKRSEEARAEAAERQTNSDIVTIESDGRASSARSGTPTHSTP
jgi:hypothetical protein